MMMKFSLDLLMALWLVVMIFIGYTKGMVNRALSFAFTIINLVFSWFLSKLIANYIHLSIDLPMKEWIAPLASRVIAFVGCFVVVAIVFSMVLHLLNAFIKTIKKHLHLLVVVDGLLGVLFNGLKGIIYLYMALCMMSLPMFNTTAAMVSQSTLAPYVMSLAPHSFEALRLSAEKLYEFSYDQAFDVKDFIELMSSLYQLGLMDGESANMLYTTYQAEIDNLESVRVGEPEASNLILKLMELPLSEAFKSVIQSKIVIN